MPSTQRAHQPVTVARTLMLIAIVGAALGLAGCSSSTRTYEQRVAYVDDNGEVKYKTVTREYELDRDRPDASSNTGMGDMDCSVCGLDN